ncbi:MAG TPA: type II secretion system F family protein [Armatimonadota bacterium]|jgi:general secretion pathway protein F
MPTYVYKGLDNAGKHIDGRLVADDERVAIAQLKARGCFPMEVAPAEGDLSAQETAPASPKRFSMGNTSGDLTVFTRQLANLFGGGIALMPTLNALTEHTESAQLRAALLRMQQDVSSGKALWEALSMHPRFFSPMYVNMVKAGEASGQLSSMLVWLADYLEKEQSRRVQIISVMIYPALLVTLGTLAVISLLIFVVPKFTSMFAEFGQSLPVLTQIVIGISNFLGHWGWALLGGIAGAVLLLNIYASTPIGRLHVDGWKLRIPIFGKLGVKTAMARFARTTATLLQGGVPLLDSLSVVRDVLGNEMLAQATDQAREGMREGESFAQRLKQTGVFPPLLTHMVGIGEETGNLRSMLTTVANTYDIEVEAMLKGLVSLLEPAIIITLALTLVPLILAMLLPMLQINLLGNG